MTKVLDFEAIIEKDEDGYYFARVPAVPGCLTQGETYAEAVKNIREALELCLEEAATNPAYKKQIIFPDQNQTKIIGLEKIHVNFSTA